VEEFHHVVHPAMAAEALLLDLSVSLPHCENLRKIRATPNQLTVDLRDIVDTSHPLTTH
jgi:hypothetical protein